MVSFKLQRALKSTGGVWSGWWNSEDSRRHGRVCTLEIPLAVVQDRIGTGRLEVTAGFSYEMVVGDGGEWRSVDGSEGSLVRMGKNWDLIGSWGQG